MKKLYITGTHNNAGKTLVTLGLTAYFGEVLDGIGFIKPLGLQDLKSRGMRIDQDTFLIGRACNVHCNIQDMNPVTVSWEFMKEYLQNDRRESLMGRIRESFNRISAGKDLVVIEGTGHAGTGAVFGLSNAYVAASLGAKVLLVSSGGVGQPIDEVVLNLALFEKLGVEVVGVVLNKAYPQEVEFLRGLGPEIFRARGVDLLGVVPADPLLASPTVLQVVEACRGEILHGESRLGERVDRTVVGAMPPDRALDALDAYAGQRILFITPGDRADMILAVLSAAVMGGTGIRLAGLLLTGGVRPRGGVMKVIERTEIPVISVMDDTYTAASRVFGMEVKITPDDREKVDLIKSLVRKHVDCEGILARL